MPVANIDAASFEDKVLNSSQTVVVDVWAPWCGPCRQMAPLFEQVAEEHGDHARFYKLNADDNQELVQHYKVLGIPTMLYFRHGRLVARKTGVQKPPAIIKRIESLASMDAEEAEREEVTGYFKNPLRKLFRRK